MTEYSIGTRENGASSLIELIVDANGDRLVEDITGLHSYIDDELINNLEDVLEELKEQNKKLNKI